MKLFSTTEELREYVHGLDATTDIGLLAPSIRSAERYVKNMLTAPVFGSVSGDGLPLLREAVANMMMYNYTIFDTIEQRKQGHEIYKYELEQKRSEYLNSFQGALDELFVWLDEFSPEWKDSFFCQARNSLLIPDVATFNRYYPIDNSHYFFTLMVPVQAEILDKHYKEVDIAANRKNNLLCRSCALLTLSKSLERFDFSQLPAAIRNSRSDGAQRNASGSESPATELLAKRLYNDGTTLYNEAVKTLNNGTFDSESDKDGNEFNSKFYSVIC